SSSRGRDTVRWLVMPSRSRGRGREVLQEGRGRHEEEVPGDRTAEVEQPVIIARWIADEHVLEHFFDRAGRAAVADEIGPELPAGCLAERHVVSEDLDLLAILRDLGECIVRKGGLDGVVQLRSEERRVGKECRCRWWGEC